MARPAGISNRLPSWEVVALCTGAVVYLVSFSLVAVNAIPGWMCAFWALTWNSHDPETSLATFGGLINPLVVVYVVQTVLKPAARTRTYLAIAIFSCVPLTWIALSRMSMEPHIGHFAWITGISLMVFPALLRIPDWPETRWIAASTLALWIWWAVPQAFRLSMHPASARDDFYYVVAWNFKQPSACEKIDPRAIGRTDQRKIGGDLTYMQSDCYRNVAALLHDPALCSRVKSAGLDRLIGSTPEKTECSLELYTQGTASPSDGQEFVQTMRAFGYSDQVIGRWIRGATLVPQGAQEPALTAEAYWNFFQDIANPQNVPPNQFPIAESAHDQFLRRVLGTK